MSRRMILGWVIVALGCTSASAQIPISRDLMPTRSALARVGLERNWFALIPLNPTEKVIEISNAEGMVFAQTDQAFFHAYDAETGRLLWSAHLGHHLADAHAASANSRLVFVTNANHLYALDRGTGRVVWVENLQNMPTSPTACDEERVMVGLDSGMLRGFFLHAVDEKGLVVKDDKGQPTLAPRPRFAWNWQTSGPMTSRPIPAGRMVVFGDRGGRAYVALSDPPPTMVYRIATGGEIFATMATYGTRTFFIPSADKNLYSVDLFTAAVTWTFSTGAPVMQEPIVAGTDVYVMNAAGVLNAVDIPTGSPRWSVATHGGRPISVSPSRIYLESQDDDLFIVDRKTGQTVADPRTTYSRAGLNLRPYNLSLTNTINDRLYLGTKSGLIISLREMGQTSPRPLRDPKAKPFGYIPAEGAMEEQATPAPNLLPATATPAAEPKPEEGAPVPEPAPEPAEPK